MKGGEFGGRDEPWETIDSEKQIIKFEWVIKIKY